MKKRRLLITALSLVAAAPVFAQPVTDFTRGAAAQYNACVEGRQNRTGEQTLALCQTADQILGQLQAQYANASVEERDYVWFIHGTVLLSVANAYVAIDGARTARVCDASERAWQGLGNISPTVSYRDAVSTSEQTVMSIIRLCRSEQGTPGWARPLP